MDKIWNYKETMAFKNQIEKNLFPRKRIFKKAKIF